MALGGRGADGGAGSWEVHGFGFDGAAGVTVVVRYCLGVGGARWLRAGASIGRGGAVVCEAGARCSAAALARA